MQAYAAVDGEVVHALLALLHEGVAEEFPCQVLSLAVYFFHGLIHGHSANRHRAVAHNPFAGLVDVVARREVHECVAAPFAAPYGFLHLLVNAARGGRVAYVGVDLDQEVSANDHWLGLRVVDVGGQHGAAGGYLVAHKLRGDVGLDSKLGAVHVLADSYVFHLGGHYAMLGVPHLGDVRSLFCSEGHLNVLKPQVVKALVRKSHAAILTGQLVEPLHSAAVHDPFLAESRKTFLEVYLGVLVAIGAAGVVDEHGVVLNPVLSAVGVYGDRWGQVDAAHSDADVLMQLSGQVYFLAAWECYLDVFVHCQLSFFLLLI